MGDIPNKSVVPIDHLLIVDGFPYSRSLFAATPEWICLMFDDKHSLCNEKL